MKGELEYILFTPVKDTCTTLASVWFVWILDDRISGRLGVVQEMTRPLDSRTKTRRRPGKAGSRRCRQGTKASLLRARCSHGGQFVRQQRGNCGVPSGAVMAPHPHA